MGRRRLSAFQRPMGRRSLGHRTPRTDPGPRPVRRAAALCHRVRWPLVVCQRGQSPVRRRSGAATASRSGRTRRPLHVLDAGGAADRLRRHRGDRAGHGPRLRCRRRPPRAVLRSGIPGRRRRVRGLARSRRRRSPSRPRERDEPADAARRRPGWQLPVGRARQLAHRIARAPRQGLAALRPSRSGSRTPSTTKPPTSG